MQKYFNSMIRIHMEWIYRITTSKGKSALTAFLALLLLSAVSLSSIHFESDIFRLFPAKEPALTLFLETLEWTGSSNEVYFLLEGEKEKLPAAASKLARRLKEAKIYGQPAFRKITWQIFDREQAEPFNNFISYAATHPQLFLTEDDAGAFLKRFSPQMSENSVLRLKSELAGQLAGEMTSLATADPLYLRELIMPRLKSAMQSLDLDPDSPYFISRDGKALIMIGEPARPVNDTSFARELVKEINRARDDSGVSVSCAGAHISAVMDEAAMKSDIRLCIISSMLVVMGIFYAVYRRILPALLLPLIIASGVLMALGSAGIFLASIHIVSFAFTALIIGLGTDYPIHLYDRFHSERSCGKNTDEALRLAITETGQALFTAAATTSVPFFALTFSDVRALYELGLLVGLGVIFSLYSTFFLLPPLLIHMDKKFPLPYGRINELGLSSLWRLTARFPRLLLTCSLLFVALMAAASTRISFDGNLKNLQPRHSEAFLTQEKIERHLTVAPKQLLVALDGDDPELLMEKGGTINLFLEKWRREKKITAFSSLGSVINNRGEQRRFIDSVNEAAKDEPFTVKPFVSALERHSFDPLMFKAFTETFSGDGWKKAIPVAEGMERLRQSPVRGVLERHMPHDDRGYHELFYIHHNGRDLDERAFLAELHRIEPAARATSVDMIGRHLADSVRESFGKVFLLGGLLVLLFLFVHFGAFSAIPYALFPVAAGTASMLGAMAAAGMGLNFMNVMVLVTIIGMGSDYGLHIRHRVDSTETAGNGTGYIQAARAVLLSALTTIAGFGSLAFADYPALASIGWATNFGIAFTAVFALATLPSFIHSRHRHRKE